MGELDLGERLRLRREELNLKQHDVAKACGVSQQNVSKWERGKSVPTVGNLTLLSGVLNLALGPLTVLRLAAARDGNRPS